MLLLLSLIVLFGNLCQAGRIVGGSDAGEGEFPYTVSIRHLGEHVCGGSIIGNRWILTAAHCLGHVENPAEFTILAGSNQLDATSEIYQVNLFVRHPGFSISGRPIDVALIRVNKGIQFIPGKVFPIELDDEYAEAKKFYWLNGWGVTDIVDPETWLSNSLQVAPFRSLSNKDCLEIINNEATVLTEDELCGKTTSTAVCVGDSGGPLVDHDTNKQVGIASWGVDQCEEGSPGVFMRVAFYKKWIFDTIKEIGNTSTQ